MTTGYNPPLSRGHNNKEVDGHRLGQEVTLNNVDSVLKTITYLTGVSKAFYRFHKLFLRYPRVGISFGRGVFFISFYL